MSNYEALAAQLAPVLPRLPAEGIGFRGDPALYAAGCLQRLSSNFILFGGDAAADVPLPGLAAELQGGVNYAIQFSYPYDWGENPRRPIAAADFTGYAAHYIANTQDLPVISWGTGTYQGQLANARKRDSGCSVPEARLTTAYAGWHGKLRDAGSSPVVATLDDIQQAEERALGPDAREAAKREWKSYRQLGRELSDTEYLRKYGRLQFHQALGGIMASRLVRAFSQEYPPRPGI